MSNFRDEDYVYILGDCLHDIFYVDSSYRGKIAQMRVLSEIIVRKLIDFNPDDQLTIGDKEVLKTVKALTYGDHFKKCILAVKNDTNDYYAANSCSHSKVRAQITKDDYSKIYDHLLDLISCLFIQFFSKHPFGTNTKIVSCFSLLPPIIRYKVLNYLYANDSNNIILIDKLVLVTLKEFGPEKAAQWVENNKSHLITIPTIAFDNMYQYSLQTISTNLKATYKTMEEAKAFFNHNKKAFVEDSEEEVREFAKLMEFFYTGRKVDTTIVPSEYVVSFHDKK